MKKTVPVITCEHAGNRVPSAFSYLFAQDAKVLGTHQGWDPGALPLAEYLAKGLEVGLHSYDFTRLLIEINRSEGHPELFSKYSNPLSNAVKKYLISTYYQPYRQSVERLIAQHIGEGHQVVHLSVHTFTPVFFGVKREVEIGLLFDPDRKKESVFCDYWQGALREELPGMDIRLNEPYQGADDGFTTYLRTRFGGKSYLGLELEVGQQHAVGGSSYLTGAILKSFQQSLLTMA